MGFTTENFEVFKMGNDKYMNFQKGENKFRILSDNIVGWEDWTKEKKPVRYRISDHPEPPKAFDATKPVKPFMAMIVWNCNEEKIQILQIKQMSVIKELQSFIIDPDWGQPYFYDIKVSKSGEGMQTKYSVKTVVPKETAKEVIETFKATPIWLDALFDSLDPFAGGYKEYTPGVFEKELAYDKISKSQTFELEDLLSRCTPEFSKKAIDGMNGRYKVNKVAQWPLDQFEKIKVACIKNIAEFGLAEAQ